jgi:hypothetical protein
VLTNIMLLKVLDVLATSRFAGNSQNIQNAFCNLLSSPNIPPPITQQVSWGGIGPVPVLRRLTWGWALEPVRSRPAFRFAGRTVQLIAVMVRVTVALSCAAGVRPAMLVLGLPLLIKYHFNICSTLIPHCTICNNSNWET